MFFVKQSDLSQSSSLRTFFVHLFFDLSQSLSLRTFFVKQSDLSQSSQRTLSFIYFVSLAKSVIANVLCEAI